MTKKPIKIIIAGALGRMGETLVSLILDSRDFELAGAVETQENIKRIEKLPCLVSSNLQEIISAVGKAVVLDFTMPSASLKNAAICAAIKMPLVIGTTGFTVEQKITLENYAKETPLLLSANMSVGINALMDVLPLLSKILGPGYDMEIMELHHKRKKDAPSGTALMLADSLAKSRDWDISKVRNSTRDGLVGERKEEELGVVALRGGDVVGIHSTYFLGPGEFIQITHTAESRENFAMGALRAALWLNDQKSGSLYSMRDVLGLTNTENNK